MISNPANKILIIEDDGDIAFAICTLLESEGYDVAVAENGIVALSILKEKGVPNLILLDMMMPKMNGWEFAAEFRSQYPKNCPIIVMTAAADAKQRAADIDAAEWIEKPFAFKKFLELISKYVNCDQTTDAE